MKKYFLTMVVLELANYFIEKPKLTQYLINKKLDTILKTLLGEPYVLEVLHS